MNEPQAAPTSPATEPHGCDFVSRNFRVNNRRTSVRLEIAMWQAFEDIAARENTSLREICATIDAQRHGANLTAALRLFIISYFRLAAEAKAENPPPQLRIVTPGTQNQSLLNQALQNQFNPAAHSLHNPALHHRGFADSATSAPAGGPSPLMQRALNAIK